VQNSKKNYRLVEYGIPHCMISLKGLGKAYYNSVCGFQPQVLDHIDLGILGILIVIDNLKCST